MSKDHSVEADYYLYGIELGILGFEDAIEWADKIIAEEAEPDIEIIDIALSRPQGRNGVMEALAAIKGSRQPQVAGRMLLKDLNSLLQNGGSLKAIASKALIVTWATDMPEDIRWEFDHVDDDIALAEQGIYTDIDQCKVELQSLLDRYQYHSQT